MRQRYRIMNHDPLARSHLYERQKKLRRSFISFLLEYQHKIVFLPTLS